MKSLKTDSNSIAVRKNKNPLYADSWQLYALCAIPVLLVFIFCYLPMGGIIIAFKNGKRRDGFY